MKNNNKKPFKAIIRVCKSLIEKEDGYGFDTVEVLREPLIYAKDKSEVKSQLVEKYPQFFQNGKIYEKETKRDKAQFFYVVIFELYNHEIELINEGSWVCDHCGHIHENKYLSRPIESRKFEGKIFCGNDYKTGNNIVSHSCYELWKKEKFKHEELPDDLDYITKDSKNYIYKCTEKVSGKCYIGKTRNAPFFRWWNHLTHSSSPFGMYLRQTSLSDWTFEVLEELSPLIDESEVLRIESEYILRFNSIENGFNSLISNKQAVLQEVGTLFD